MGKIGRSYTRVDNLSNDNAAAAYRRFARSTTDAEDKKLRQEITVAVIGLVFLLGLVGWALTL
jgi:hypothetical protein